MGIAPLPLDYMQSSSHTTLESLELARLSAASNLRKELHDVVEEWVEAEVQARMARWIRQHAETDSHLPHVEPLSLPVASSVDSLPNRTPIPCDPPLPSSMTAERAGAPAATVAHHLKAAIPESIAAAHRRPSEAGIERHKIGVDSHPLALDHTRSSTPLESPRSTSTTLSQDSIAAAGWKSSAAVMQRHTKTASFLFPKYGKRLRANTVSICGRPRQRMARCTSLNAQLSLDHCASPQVRQIVQHASPPAAAEKLETQALLAKPKRSPPSPLSSLLFGRQISRRRFRRNPCRVPELQRKSRSTRLASRRFRPSASFRSAVVHRSRTPIP